VILDAYGIKVELPAGWSGRVFSRAQGVATLHAANFALPLNDGEFGDRSTALMHSGSAFLALTEYRPGSGLQPGHGLFSPARIPRRLDPTSFSAAGLAHARPGQSGVQHFFSTVERPFCLYVVVAGPRNGRRRQLAAVEHLLSTLRIARR
jgi:hypothetical protein